MSGRLSRSTAASRLRFIAAVPLGFKIGYHSRQGKMEISEFIPKRETVNDWSRIMTIEVFHGDANADPDLFAIRFKEGWVGVCKGGRARAGQKGRVNGYRYSRWEFVCPLNPQTGKPETMSLKVISGRDSLYAAQYAFRQAPSEVLASEASTYLDSVSVCDTRVKAQACPAGM